MSKIKIITDSTAYIREDYINNANISVVPLSYKLGEETSLEGKPGEFDEYFNKLESTDLFPTTSQPATGEFVKAFEEAFEDGYDEIIAILLSSKLSGTYNSALLARDMLEDKSITIIDSNSAVANLRYFIEDAVKMANEGISSLEIEKHIREIEPKTRAFLTTDTLEYLSRGGRLSSFKASVGNILSIKPIVTLDDGELRLDDKIRGKNKAFQTIVGKIPENVEKVTVCHVLNIEEAEKMRNMVLDKFPNIQVEIDEVGPVIGSHLGPKMVGLCYLTK